MIDTDQIQDLIDQRYNYGISVYDHGDCIRVTNGSAGMYADLAVTDAQIEFRGERYGTSFEGTCEATADNLFDVLATNLGL